MAMAFPPRRPGGVPVNMAPKLILKAGVFANRKPPKLERCKKYDSFTKTSQK